MGEELNFDDLRQGDDLGDKEKFTDIVQRVINRILEMKTSISEVWSRMALKKVDEGNGRTLPRLTSQDKARMFAEDDKKLRELYKLPQRKKPGSLGYAPGGGVVLATPQMDHERIEQERIAGQRAAKEAKAKEARAEEAKMFKRIDAFTKPEEQDNQGVGDDAGDVLSRIDQFVPADKVKEPA